MSANTAPIDYAVMSERELARAEIEIARKYIGGFPYFMALWGIANLLTWLSVMVLAIGGFLSLWIAFPISVVTGILAYLPSHDAQHSTYGKNGSRLRWFNEFMGYISTIQIMQPYKILRITHLEHHAHTNDAELDPDYSVAADSWWQHLWVSYNARQPGSKKSQAISYANTLVRLGMTPPIVRAIVEANIQKILTWTIISALAWSGYAIEVTLLWWLSSYLAGYYLALMLSWAPHHPHPEQGRYRNTRHFTFALGNLATLGMEAHIVHHLHPSMPLTKNAAAYRVLQPILDARGCRAEQFSTR